MPVLVSDILTYANSLIQGNAAISDATGLEFTNDANEDYHLELVKRGVEASEVQEAYRDVTVPPAGQGSTFLFPDDYLFLKTLSVNNTISPTAGGAVNYEAYNKALPADISNTQQNVSFEFLRVNQPADVPLYDNRGDWYEVFPTFTSGMNLIQAIRLFYYLIPTAYTSTSDTLNYPESANFRTLAYKVVSLYYDSIMDTENSGKWQGRYMGRLERQVKMQSKGEDTAPQPRGLGLTGGEF